jgi:type III pantothenate kinase
MGRSLLTVDLGNTAVKLRAWREGAAAREACIGRVDLQLAEHSASELAQFFADFGRFEHGALISVAADSIRAAWCERIAPQLRTALLCDLDCGLENRTLEPARVGRDRLFAARGALELLGDSALVVDIGTALKVDALLVFPDAPPGPRGAFLGGAIAPGPALLARALASGAAKLFAVDPIADPPALGRDSAAAMRAGIGVGLRGAVRELVSQVADEAGWSAPPIALTGGARAFARQAFDAARVHECEDLVHLGMCAALREHAQSARSAQ